MGDVLTPRFGILFTGLFTILLVGEWYRFFRGFDTSLWDTSNWFILLFAILAEAFAVAVITRAVDHALPAAGGRAPTKTSRNRRRSRQDYRPR
jgi:hypothetical protein